MMEIKSYENSIKLNKKTSVLYKELKNNKFQEEPSSNASEEGENKW